MNKRLPYIKMMAFQVLRKSTGQKADRKRKYIVKKLPVDW